MSALLCSEYQPIHLAASLWGRGWGGKPIGPKLKESLGKLDIPGFRMHTGKDIFKMTSCFEIQRFDVQFLHFVSFLFMSQSVFTQFE